MEPLEYNARPITRCMRFSTLTQIAPLRSATSHTPRTLYKIPSPPL
nr:hypothetical protein GZ36D8_16 [uncultured archaeon GZfos36D8]